MLYIHVCLSYVATKCFLLTYIQRYKAKQFVCTHNTLDLTLQQQKVNSQNARIMWMKTIQQDLKSNNLSLTEVIYPIHRIIHSGD